MSITRRKKVRQKEARGRKDSHRNVIGRNAVEIAAVVLAVCIIAVIMTLSNVTPPPVAEDGSKAPVDVIKCVSDNPSMSEESCWDIYYHDKAIKDDDKAICGYIKDAAIEAHCEGYFS